MKGHSLLRKPVLEYASVLTNRKLRVEEREGWLEDVYAEEWLL